MVMVEAESATSSLTQSELVELKLNVKSWLDTLSTNGNLAPEAWNMYYALRESGTIKINHEVVSEEKNYAVASAVVTLLLRLYGKREPDKESILFERLSEEKRVEHNSKEGVKKVPKPRKKSLPKLIEYVDQMTIGGVAALAAYLR